MFVGGFRGNDQPAAAQEASGPNSQQLYQAPNERYSTERCNLYQKEFMKCLDQSGGDSTQCQGFWEALKVKLSCDFFFITYSLCIFKECQRFHSNNGMLFYVDHHVFI